jgi:hypothetical protein
LRTIVRASDTPGQGRAQACPRRTERVAHEVEVGADVLRPSWGLDHDRRPRCLDHLLQDIRAHLSLAQVGVAVRTRAGGIAGVVRVEQVDPPDDRQHPRDRVPELLPGRVGVAGVEAEAELDVGLRR